MTRIGLIAALILLGACGESESDPAPSSGGTAGQTSGGSSGKSGSGGAGQSSGGQASGGQSGSGVGGSPSGGSGAVQSGGAAGSAAGAGGSAGAGAAGSGGAGGGVNCDCARGAYIPMCGIDGMTHDATCGIECVPVDIACLGQCPCSGEPSCDIGCTAMSGTAWCADGSVEWVCQVDHGSALLREAGCEELPTGAIRYCCPDSFLTECQ